VSFEMRVFRPRCQFLDTRVTHFAPQPEAFLSESLSSSE
jgi:hypothetical protein